MSRNCTLPDVSMTQDVTTPEPPEDALHARIAELEAAQRWIPVSERLPDGGHREFYEVACIYQDFGELALFSKGRCYNIFDKTHQRRIWIEDQGEFGHEDITKYVTHWRERPTPPEVK